MGLNQQDLPYPGAVQSSGNPMTVNNIAGAGWLKGAIMAAALLIGGGGATAVTLGLAGLLGPKNSLAPSVVQPPTPTGPQGVEWEIEFGVKDGKPGFGVPKQTK